MIGNNIAKLRQARNITQQTLASAIGVPRTTVAHLERGTWQPSADTMKLISDYFKVPLGDIFFNPDVLKNTTSRKRSGM